MNPTRVDHFEVEFANQHEDQAQLGWPGAWADLPVFDEVWESWSKEDRDVLLAEGLKAFQGYLEATADRYREYRHDAKVAASDAERKGGWEKFVAETRRERYIFRTIVFSKFISLRGP